MTDAVSKYALFFLELCYLRGEKNFSEEPRDCRADSSVFSAVRAGRGRLHGVEE